MEPVLQELRLDSVCEKNLPRVWWIGVGPLAKAPFHAAGDHSPRSTRNTLSRVISSYIPSIKALSYAREKRLELSTACSLLLVAMPTTPESPAIAAIPATHGSMGIPGTRATPTLVPTAYPLPTVLSPSPALLPKNGSH